VLAEAAALLGLDPAGVLGRAELAAVQGEGDPAALR
jgi:hypothetical protein